MKNELPGIDPGHDAKRTTLNRVGLGLLVAGVCLFLGGVVGFARPFFADNPFAMSFGGSVLAMFSAFVGFVMIGAGLQMLMIGNAGRLLRYQAGEILPVAEDAARHVAPTANDLTRGLIRSAREGWDEGVAEPQIAHSCGTLNEPDDRYCKGCGQALGRTCGSCSASNDADARFCDRCGTPLQETA